MSAENLKKWNEKKNIYQYKWRISKDEKNGLKKMDWNASSWIRDNQSSENHTYFHQL